MAQKIQEQLGQVWQRLLPLLQRFAFTLLASSLPTLDRWSEQLNVIIAEEAEGQSTPQPLQKQVQKQLVKFLAQSLQKLIPVLKQWQENLQPAATTEDASTTTAEPLVPENVRQELSTAWQFVQTKLFPVILQFLQRVVDFLDPPLSRFYQVVQEKSATVPLLVKFNESPIKKRVATAWGPVERFVEEKTPEPLQPIVAKKAASYTLVVLLVLFFLFKPSRAHTVAKLPATTTPTTSWTSTRSDKPVIPPNKILVTDIQSQVAKVARTFGEGLIQSVQANFRLGKLVVLVTDEWYQLSAPKQDQMMNSLLENSLQMGFKKLLLADTHQTLLARNPDVGSQMVVLQRQPQ